MNENAPPMILCVGRNYQQHIKEMNARREEEPVIFMKQPRSYNESSKIFIPEVLGTLHYEVELAVLIGRELKNASEDESEAAIEGYGVAIDFTLRELQTGFKNKGLPWELSKAFDNSAPCGRFIKKEAFSDNPQNCDISLSVNGKTVQSSNTAQMLFKPSEIISYASRFITIPEGTILLTGTPEGVGPAFHEDQFEAKTGTAMHRFTLLRK